MFSGLERLTKVDQLSVTDHKSTGVGMRRANDHGDRTAPRCSAGFGVSASGVDDSSAGAQSNITAMETAAAATVTSAGKAWADAAEGVAAG